MVVCAANVCRSPLAELILKRELAALPDVRIESAGTRVVGAARICEKVSGREGGEEWVRASRDHRSHPVAGELLREASLILVADRDVRSVVVAALPEARGRVFTFLDAAHSADGFSPDAPTRRAGIVARFAAHLDGRRAVRGPELTRRPLFRSRGDVNRSDIRDGHGHSARAHERALREVDGAMMGIASGLVGSRAGARQDI